MALAKWIAASGDENEEKTEKKYKELSGRGAFDFVKGREQNATHSKPSWWSERHLIIGLQAQWGKMRELRMTKLKSRLTTGRKQFSAWQE